MKTLIAAASGALFILTGTIWLMTPYYTCSAAAGSDAGDQALSASYAGYVGWYRLTEDRHALVTWGASGGLRLIDFEQPAFRQLTRQSDDTFRISTNQIASTQTIEFTRDDTGSVIELRWNNGDPRTAAKDDNFGYGQAQVSYRHGDIRLAATVLIPRGEGPHPGVVVIHGSGLSDRDNLWYWTIVNRLARNGIAVLFPDKRGAGRSEGDWCIADFSDLAGDALAGFRLLQQQSAVDPTRIGLLGISQGGWIAPIAAHRAPDVAYLITISSSTVGPSEQFLHETRHTLQDEYGLPPIAAHLLAPVTTQVSMSKNRKWWKRTNEFDPLPYWKELRIPALVVYGEDDPNVPVAESVDRLEQTIAASATPAITVQTYPDSGHGLFDPQTGWIRNGFLTLLSEWTNAHRR